MSSWRRRGGKLVRRLLPQRTGAVILGYHRIADPREAPGGDPFRLCVSPRHFASQMDAVRELGHPVSLLRLGEALENGEPVRGMVCITFDDGYEEVLTAALPELERREIPATVFFVSGSFGRTFWWDRLSALVARADPAVPLRISAGPSPFTWTGTGGADELRNELHRTLRVLGDEAREDTLDRLARAWTGEELALARALTQEASRRLLASPAIEAGSHTISHPPLTEVPPRRVEEEIAGSRHRLEEVLNAEVRMFSYPHGRRNAQTDRLVRAAGYALACGSRQDSVRPGEEMFGLPRVWPADRAGGDFHRRLRRYLGRSARST